MARPRIYDADVLAEHLLEYIDITDQPFIQEFCLNEDVSENTLYRLEKENEALSKAIKKALKKQELFMLKNASTGKINPIFTIFRLKQPAFGYTDKQDFAVTAQAIPYDPKQLQEQLRSLLDGLTDDERLALMPHNE